MVRIRTVALPTVALALAACCDDAVLQSIASPSGRYAVRVSTLNCGATTAYRTTVALTRPGWLGTRRDLFSLEHGYGAGAVQDPATAPLRFAWEGDSVLVVAYMSTATPPRRPARELDVAIRYVPAAP